MERSGSGLSEDILFGRVPGKPPRHPKFMPAKRSSTAHTPDVLVNSILVTLPAWKPKHNILQSPGREYIMERCSIRNYVSVPGWILLDNCQVGYCSTTARLDTARQLPGWILHRKESRGGDGDGWTQGIPPQGGKARCKGGDGTVTELLAVLLHVVNITYHSHSVSEAPPKHQCQESGLGRPGAEAPTVCASPAGPASPPGRAPGGVEPPPPVDLLGPRGR
eukprot:gene7989-biopygen6096